MNVEDLKEIALEFVDHHKLLLSGTAFSVIALYIMSCCCGHGKCRSEARLDNKTVLITGANTGLGKETAKEIARRGARVLVACRNVDKAQAAVQEIKEETGNTNVVLYRLDLASLKSVRECAGEVLKKEERLDVLINNAGVGTPPAGSKTEDGFELQFGVNHLGHFLLTNLLLDLLKKSAPSRIVIVSAKAHEFVKLDFDDLNNKRNIAQWKQYSRSKLANVLFGLELSKRLKGTQVTTYSLHPGILETDLIRHQRESLGCCWSVIKCCLWPFQKLFMKDLNQGIQTTIYCAVAEELDGVTGKYYSDCKEKAASEDGANEEDASRLWTISEEMVGLQDSSPK